MALLKIMISVIYLCPLWNLKLFEIFSWNSMQIYITMILFAKHKNCNWITCFWSYCPYCPLKFVSSDPSHIYALSITWKRFQRFFCKNVNGYEITCRTHFIFDKVMALAWCNCSGGAWCSACSAFIKLKLKQAFDSNTVKMVHQIFMPPPFKEWLKVHIM